MTTPAVDPAEALRAIEHALATGELEVMYAGRRVQYRSVDDLEKAAAYWRRQLAAASPTGQPPRIVHVRLR